MNSHSIMYWIAKNGYNFKSILIFAFIKAIIPLFSYDGEPSVSNGIVFQLPSSHLFIHWVPTKLSNRVMPYGGNSCQLQLLFLFDSYRPAQSHGNLFSQWTLPSMLLSAGFVADAVLFRSSIVTGLLSRTLPESGHAESRQGSGIVMPSACYAACVICCAGRFISDSSFFGS